MHSKKFEIGDKVIVSSKGGWKNDCTGFICGGAEPVDTLKGSESYYWVKFDQPEQDINDNHQYIKAQILSYYIEKSN